MLPEVVFGKLSVEITGVTKCASLCISATILFLIHSFQAICVFFRATRITVAFAVLG